MLPRTDEVLSGWGLESSTVAKDEMIEWGEEKETMKETMKTEPLNRDISDGLGGGGRSRGETVASGGSLTDVFEVRERAKSHEPEEMKGRGSVAKGKAESAMVVGVYQEGEGEKVVLRKRWEELEEALDAEEGFGARESALKRLLLAYAGR